MNLAKLFIAFGVSSFLVCTQAEATDLRSDEQFENWKADNLTAVTKFSDFLKSVDVEDVFPLYELTRTATDWKRCKAAPFAVPPETHWPAVRKTLELARELIKTGVIQNGEVVSAYRGDSLNRCAHGAPGSQHVRSFAIDIAASATSQKAICTFWRVEGARWNMGLSRYSSGRIHIDTSKYRTWGDDLTRRSSYCQQ